MERITIHIDDKKLLIAEDLLERIPFFGQNLEKIKSCEQFYLDRDPDLFNEMLDYVRYTGSDEELLIDATLNYELELFFNNHDKVQSSLNDQIYIIDCCGEIFRSCKKTLEKIPYFSNIFKFSSKICYLDMNPKKFSQILSHIRNEEVKLDFNSLKNQLMYLNYSVKKNNKIVKIPQNKLDKPILDNFITDKSQYINQVPEITFQKSVYRRYTQFILNHTMCDFDVDNEIKIYELNFDIIKNITIFNPYYKTNNICDLIDKIEIIISDDSNDNIINIPMKSLYIDSQLVNKNEFIHLEKNGLIEITHLFRKNSPLLNLGKYKITIKIYPFDISQKFSAKISGIYLNIEEKNKFLRLGHEYLINNYIENKFTFDKSNKTYKLYNLKNTCVKYMTITLIPKDESFISKCDYNYLKHARLIIHNSENEKLISFDINSIFSRNEYINIPDNETYLLRFCHNLHEAQPSGDLGITNENNYIELDIDDDFEGEIYVTIVKYDKLFFDSPNPEVFEPNEELFNFELPNEELLVTSQLLNMNNNLDDDLDDD
ncbi:MAG: hypothetical protein CMF62_00405 [Magnetococcales bacterium]|nr:hypothetical protein [Magnetococcales bacterium]|tara:strand:- start:445 stop:2076 length:1632 start_codon:yes stop_codon:yes gene_type:complete